MVELSLFERLKLIFSLVFSSPLFLVLLLSIAIMLIDAFVISKKSKNTKILYIIISALSIIILLDNYYSSLLNVLDTIAKNLVTIIYFPSVLEYILIMIITLIILFISIFRKNTNRIIKRVNIIVTSINTYLFFLILDIISKNKIDLTNKVSIYSNENLMAIFELSVIIFVAWIIGLILYKIIKRITLKKEDYDLPKLKNNFYEEPDLPKTIEELRKEELIPPPQIEYILVERNNNPFTLEELKALKRLLENMKNK